MTSPTKSAYAKLLPKLNSVSKLLRTERDQDYKFFSQSKYVTVLCQWDDSEQRWDFFSDVPKQATLTREKANRIISQLMTKKYKHAQKTSPSKIALPDSPLVRVLNSTKTHVEEDMHRLRRTVEQLAAANEKLRRQAAKAQEQERAAQALEAAALKKEQQEEEERKRRVEKKREERFAELERHHIHAHGGLERSLSSENLEVLLQLNSNRAPRHMDLGFDAGSRPGSPVGARAGRNFEEDISDADRDAFSRRVGALGATNSASHGGATRQPRATTSDRNTDRKTVAKSLAPALGDSGSSRGNTQHEQSDSSRRHLRRRQSSSKSPKSSHGTRRSSPISKSKRPKSVSGTRRRSPKPTLSTLPTLSTKRSRGTVSPSRRPKTSLGRRTTTASKLPRSRTALSLSPPSSKPRTLRPRPKTASSFCNSRRPSVEAPNKHFYAKGQYSSVSLHTLRDLQNAICPPQDISRITGQHSQDHSGHKALFGVRVTKKSMFKPKPSARASVRTAMNESKIARSRRLSEAKSAESDETQQTKPTDSCGANTRHDAGSNAAISSSTIPHRQSSAAPHAETLRPSKRTNVQPAKGDKTSRQPHKLLPRSLVEPPRQRKPDAPSTSQPRTDKNNGSDTDNGSDSDVDDGGIESTEDSMNALGAALVNPDLARKLAGLPVPLLEVMTKLEVVLELLHAAVPGTKIQTKADGASLFIEEVTVKVRAQAGVYFGIY